MIVDAEFTTEDLIGFFRYVYFVVFDMRTRLEEWRVASLYMAVVKSKRVIVKIVHQSTDLRTRRSILMPRWNTMGALRFWSRIKDSTAGFLGVNWKDCALVWIDEDNDAVSVLSAACVETIAQEVTQSAIQRAQQCGRGCKTPQIVLHATVIRRDKSKNMEADPVFHRLLHQVTEVYLGSLTQKQRRGVNKALKYPPLAPQSIKEAHRAIRRISDAQDLLMTQEKEAEQHAQELLRQEEEEKTLGERAAEAKREKRRKRKEQKKLRCQTTDLSVENTDSPPMNSPFTDEVSAEANECSICMNTGRDWMCWPCRHLCLCEVCAVDSVKNQKNPTCPICNQKCDEVFRVYV